MSCNVECTVEKNETNVAVVRMKVVRGWGIRWGIRQPKTESNKAERRERQRVGKRRVKTEAKGGQRGHRVEAKKR